LVSVGISAGGAVDAAPACTNPPPVALTLNFKVRLSSFTDATVDQAIADGDYDQSDPATAFPTTQPYSTTAPRTSGLYMPLHGGETSSTTVLTNVVDWVVIELRDPTNVATVVATDVVPAMADGTAQRPATFQAPAGSYYVTVDNRNHLGVTTADTVPLSSATAPLVDFTSLSTNVFSGPAGSVAPETFVWRSITIRQLWAGDIVHDGAVNQLDQAQALTDFGASRNGYQQSDVNDDARVDGLDYVATVKSVSAGAISYARKFERRPARLCRGRRTETPASCVRLTIPSKPGSGIF